MEKAVEEEPIPYWKSSAWSGALVEQKGNQGCFICPDPNIKLSLDRAPPPLRDQPAMPKENSAKEARRKEDPWVNLFEAGVSAVKAVKDFKVWLDTPIMPSNLDLPPKNPKEPAPQWMVDYAHFDLQDIPQTIRNLGMPKAAKMFDKWFAGEVNYSLTELDSRAEINQLGKSYPPSMIDTKSISIDWVLAFSRAKIEFEDLIKNGIYSANSIKSLAQILVQHKDRHVVNAWDVCGEDIRRLHREFQFQRVRVEGGYWQKIKQYATQLIFKDGIPDELTLILGSFNLYAAISRVVFARVANRRFATVTHIYVYVRDGFTFTDDLNRASQYLGHWSKKTLAIVPMKMATSYGANINWVNYPVVEKHGVRASILYPVLNSDFRAWQMKHHRGGDYMIYTDRRAIMLDKPIVVELP